jgi:hypothetical protein
MLLKYERARRGAYSDASAPSAAGGAGVPLTVAEQLVLHTFDASLTTATLLASTEQAMSKQLMLQTLRSTSQLLDGFSEADDVGDVVTPL